MYELLNNSVTQDSSERERTIKKSRLRWEDNIKMNIKEIQFEGVKLVQLVQDNS
jgi:hypothetical protein